MQARVELQPGIAGMFLCSDGRPRGARHGIALEHRHHIVAVGLDEVAAVLPRRGNDGFQQVPDATARSRISQA